MRNIPMFHPLYAEMHLPDRVAFRLGGLEVYWFGIFLAAGILVAILLAQFEVKRRKLPEDTAIDICLVTIPTGIIGARIAHVLMFRSSYFAAPATILQLWDGGLNVYGAIIAALIGLAVYARAKKQPLFRLTDLIVPGLAFAQGLAMWGDFFNQEGYGAVVENAAHKWFPLAVYIERSESIRYAVFFYEFVWCMLLFVLLWFILRKRAKRSGTLTLWYTLLYAFGHALFTFFRADKTYLYGNIPTASAVCAVFFITSLVFLLIRTIQAKKAAPASDALCETNFEAAPEGKAEPDAAKAEPDAAKAEPDAANESPVSDPNDPNEPDKPDAPASDAPEKKE